MKFGINILTIILLSLSSCNLINEQEEEYFRVAEKNGALVNEGYNRCMLFVTDWLKEADSVSGLIPQNLFTQKGLWNAHNTAADNYPFMVLTSYLLNDSLYNGRMLEMLKTEKKITSRLGSMPAQYSFLKQGFLNSEIDTGQIIYGTSEYIKDGLLPITEYIGKSPWSDRMIEMLNDLSGFVTVSENLQGNYFGNSVDTEINGELLQTLSRLYWMTSNDRYLSWAIAIGDYYLIDHPEILQSAKRLRLRDHGCEIIGGLSELYVTLNYVDKAKKNSYKNSLYTFLDRVLEVGRNDDGMFYNTVNMNKGTVLDSVIVDNWGYLYNAYYTVYMVDNHVAYKETVLHALNNLYPEYCNYNWENGSSDGFADAIESGICLYNREPIPNLKTWIDNEIEAMWTIQDNKIENSGIIEGWHGDGNFARTSIMYCLWKSNGVVIRPWRDDLSIGTNKIGDELYISISADKNWTGKLYFEKKRHQELLNLPVDYPRINHFPEWYPLIDETLYKVTLQNKNSKLSGKKLKQGIEIELKKNIQYQIKIIKA